MSKSFDNILKLVEVIERDLNDRVDLFADAYANIYKHYDNAVKKLLDDKEELDKKIQDAFQERKEIIKGKWDKSIILGSTLLTPNASSKSAHGRIRISGTKKQLHL